MELPEVAAVNFSRDPARLEVAGGESRSALGVLDALNPRAELLRVEDHPATGRTADLEHVVPQRHGGVLLELTHQAALDWHLGPRSARERDVRQVGVLPELLAGEL